MKKITILTMIIGVAIGSSACSFEFSTNGTNSSNKPANTANSASNAGNSNANKANTTSNTNSSSSNSSKTEVKDEKANRPTDAKKQPNAPTIPAEWIYYSDEARGYGFSLPKGSSSSNGSSGGVDSFLAETPDKIGVIVWAFKDKTMTKEDLLDFAEKALDGLGETVTAGELKGESDDYAVADADSVVKGGTEKSKLKILVATDVTDNYVMVVRSAAADYDKNKATMENIWGSFEMYSGGASGN